MMTLIILMMCINDSRFKNFDFIEHCIFNGASNGVPTNDPGVIFRLYSNGDLFIKVDSQYLLYNVEEKQVKSIVRYFFTILEKENIDLVSQDHDLEIFSSDSGDSIITTNHGVVSTVRLKQTNHDYLIISSFLPKRNKLSKLVKKVQRLAHKKRLMSSDSNFKNDQNLFPIVLGIYFEQWHSQ